jgi:hypothetical protein
MKSSKNNNSGSGRGCGLASVEMAFADSTVKAIEAGVNLICDIAADYRLCEAKATNFNIHLMALGCRSFWDQDGWHDKMKDGIQEGITGLHLWRRGLKLWRDESGADTIVPDFKPRPTSALDIKKSESSVVWTALRSVFSGISETAESRAIDNAIAFEQWRDNCRDEDGTAGGESLAERAARRRKMLPVVLKAYIAKAKILPGGKGCKTGLHTRRRFAKKIEKWVLPVLDGKDSKAAAAKAGFNGTTRKNALQALAGVLKGAGFPVTNGNWRKRLHPGPTGRGAAVANARRWFPRGGTGAGAGVLA